MKVELTKDLISRTPKKRVAIPKGVVADVIFVHDEGYAVVDYKYQMWFVPKDHCELIGADE